MAHVIVSRQLAGGSAISGHRRICGDLLRLRTPSLKMSDKRLLQIDYFVQWLIEEYGCRLVNDCDERKAWKMQLSIC